MSSELRKNKAFKLFKFCVILLISGFLFYYLTKNWQTFKLLKQLSSLSIAAFYLITAISVVLNSSVVIILLRALDAPVDSKEMFYLQNASTLLNYLPMKFGTIYRAIFLKTHYRLSYSLFSTFFVYFTLLVTAVAVMLGLISLLIFYEINEYENLILAMLFASVLIAALVLLFVPLPLPKGNTRLTSILRPFLLGRHTIKSNIRLLTSCSLLMALNMLLYSLRLAIIYIGIGHNIHPGGVLVLGALGYVAMFIGLTPGALGIREFFLSIGGVVIGVPVEISILAAVIDRAIMLSWSFTVGSLCTLILWKKTPDDFKEVMKQRAEDN